jgi:hypothetical protein
MPGQSRGWTPGAGGSVLLFNPFPYRLNDYVEYEPWTEGERWAANHWGLVDDQNQPVACQVIEAQPATVTASKRRKNVLQNFIASLQCSFLSCSAIL